MTAVATTPPARSNGARAVQHLSVAERAALGKAARKRLPRTAQAFWEAVPERRPALDVLSDQEADRVPELLPLRHGRMLASPFAFYRGAAAVMAADLGAFPHSGLRAQLCGDAHLSNFGGFASPERDLVFDINDFDETAAGPFEWDVKRLAASVAIAGRERGLSAQQRGAAVRATVEAYRLAMRRFAELRNVDVWYARLDAERILSEAAPRDRKALIRAADRARSKDSLRAFSKLAERVDGAVRIKSEPPLVVPIEELFSDAGLEIEDEMRRLLRLYRRSLKSDRRHLLETYRYVHMARKVVGVGSVGTRAWIVLLLGRDGDDPLFLQVKQAEASVLEPFAGADPARNRGQRVVQGQWLMQASSDIFLGWLRVDGVDGRQRDHYVRQLWDWKLSPDIETMSPARLEMYARLCGWTLARAHARSGDRIAIAAYLGASDTFDRALAAFAESYADRNERDYAALAEAVASGAVTAAEAS